MKLTISILTVILCFILLISSQNFVQVHGYIFYFIQFVFISYFIFTKEKNVKYIFSPSFISIAYITLTMGLGHYAVSRNMGFYDVYYHNFIQYARIGLISSIVLLSNLTLVLSLSENGVTSNFNIEGKEFKSNYFDILILISLIVFFSIFDIDLSIFGGNGDFSYSFKLICVFFITFLLNDKPSQVRFGVYLFLVLLVALNHWDSKREILFILLFFVFYELVTRKDTIKIDFRSILYLISILVFVFFIILISSITRGYGQYGVNGNPLEAIYFIGNYLGSDFILDALVANFELSYGYGHSSNAINLVLNNKVDLLYGSTFFKILFIPFPRYLFDFKPDSMLQIYTSLYDPSFRAIGGSYPINIYSEFFWNFKYLCFFFLYVCFKYLNEFYFKLVSALKLKRYTLTTCVSLFLYVTIIQFIRGSGIEQWFIYSIIVFPFTVFLYYTFSKIKLKTN